MTKKKLGALCIFVTSSLVGAFVIFSWDPADITARIVFSTVATFAITTLLFIVLGSTKHALLWTVAFAGSLVLRVFSLGSPLNIVVLFLIVSFFEYYFSSRNA